jgi:hypothetical protein
VLHIGEFLRGLTYMLGVFGAPSRTSSTIRRSSIALLLSVSTLALGIGPALAILPAATAMQGVHA